MRRPLFKQRESRAQAKLLVEGGAAVVLSLNDARNNYKDKGA